MGLQLLHPCQRLFQRRDLPAQLTAQIIAPLQQFNIRPMGRDPVHLGDGLPLRRSDTDDQAVGYGKDLRLYPVGREQPADRLLHPVDLRSALHQLAPHTGPQIHKLIIIHLVMAGTSAPTLLFCFAAAQRPSAILDSIPDSVNPSRRKSLELQNFPCRVKKS